MKRDNLQNHLLSIFVFTLVSSLFSCTGSEPDLFQSFLTKFMREYPKWAIDRGYHTFELSQPIKLKHERGNLKFMGEIWNQSLYCLSDAIDVDINADLVQGTARISLVTKCSATGEYKVDGSIFSCVAIQGSGQFRIDNSTTKMLLVLGFDGIVVTDNHIVLPKQVSGSYAHNLWSVKMNLENLSARDNENIVKRKFVDEYRAEIAKLASLPPHQHIREYFDEIFANTTVSEILRLQTPLCPITNTSDYPTVQNLH